MAHGWEGERLRLVPLERERHFENALRWINDPDVTRFLLVGDFPLTRIAEEEWFEKASQRTETDQHFAIETLEGEHIGFSGIHGISWRHGTAHTGTMIGATDFWGRGLGTEAAILRTRYAFDCAGLRLLLSGYLEGNDRSRRMLEKAGYREYGRLARHLWKRGAYREHVLMACERDGWIHTTKS